MKIEIKFKRLNSCDECPCVATDGYDSWCQLGYWGGDKPDREYDKKFHGIRPARCIEENGE